MTILILTGELSGDRYGGRLARSMRSINPQIRLIGVGGHEMSAAGVQLMAHIRDISIMGFTEIFRHLARLRQLKREIVSRIPEVDAVICIDFPDFNLAIVREIVRLPHRPKLFYFVPPQVWIWRPSRVYQLRDYFDGVFPIFDFENAFLLAHGVRSHYFGHPLSDFLQTDEYPQKRHENQDALKILVLPGSRNQEVRNIFPVMLACILRYWRDTPRAMHIMVGRAPSVHDSHYTSAIRQAALPPTIGVEWTDSMADGLQTADLVLSKSGTVNLEIAWAARPAIIVYKTSWITYFIARVLVETKFISLINILGNAQIVREFIQQDARPDLISREMHQILSDDQYRTNMVNALNKIRVRLFAKGRVHDAIARSILDELGEAPGRK